MAEATKKKGKVTSLASLFPPEETQKASERVQNAMLERRKHLDQLKEFIVDNTNLINLAQTLPNELRHDIMVPFGKAAFFPGQLVHTNEFMVLLGEGYFAERTSKQTVEILKRRGKALESQVESLKAEIEDLKVEASFFDATAAEAKEGLVQIVEDYVEETASHDVSEPGNSETDSSRSLNAGNLGTAEDEEFERIFARIAELEKEEEEAAHATEDEEDEQNEHVLNSSTNRLSPAQEVISSEGDSSNLLSVHKDESSCSEAPAIDKPNPIKKAWQLPRIKETVQSTATAENEIIDRPLEPPERGTNSRKAFTGSIVEHTRNLELAQMEQSSARSSKPVSRFKLRRQ